MNNRGIVNKKCTDCMYKLAVYLNFLSRLTTTLVRPIQLHKPIIRVIRKTKLRIRTNEL